MSVTIKLARIDKRLLHATVALNWNQFVNVNAMIVVDPTYVDDPFIEKVMQLCLPKTMGVHIFNVTQLMQFINEEKEPHKIMVIFKDLQTAKEAVEAGFLVDEIQLPYPASRIVIKKLEDYFSESDIRAMRVIQKAGIKLFFQTSPMDNKEYGVFKR